MKYHIFTALWEGSLGHSKAFFDHILNLQLKVISDELKDEEVEYHIVCTNEADKNLYVSLYEASNIRYVGPKISFRIYNVRPETPPQIKLNYLSQQFIREYENSGDVLIYNVPDYIYSWGTFNWVKANLKAGKKICSIYTPKVIRECVLEKNLLIYPRTLWMSIKDLLHEGHLKQFTDSEIGFIKYPSGIYYRTKSGHVCFPITMHPFAFRLDRSYSPQTYQASMSIEQGLQSCYNEKEFILQSSISDFLVAELTRMELPWADDTDYLGYSHELIKDWFQFGEMGELQRMFLRHRIHFSYEDDGDIGSDFHKILLEHIDVNYYNNRGNQQ